MPKVNDIKKAEDSNRNKIGLPGFLEIFFGSSRSSNGVVSSAPSGPVASRAMVETMFCAGVTWVVILARYKCLCSRKSGVEDAEEDERTLSGYRRRGAKIAALGRSSHASTTPGTSSNCTNRALISL